MVVVKTIRMITIMMIWYGILEICNGGGDGEEHENNEDYDDDDNDEDVMIMRKIKMDIKLIFLVGLQYYRAW